MTRTTYERLFEAAEAAIRAGRGVILDATFADPAHRAGLRRRFEGIGIRTLFLETSAEDAVVRQRLKVREAKADEISDARLEDFDALTRL